MFLAGITYRIMFSRIILAFFLALAVTETTLSFRVSPLSFSRRQIRACLPLAATPSEDPSTPGSSTFNGAEFEAALKKAGPVWSGIGGDGKSDTVKTINKLREEQEAREEIYREYPFQETMLPVLPDCNNYYSGKFEEYFWHQNADQVYVYIPIDNEATKADVDVTFDVKKVTVKVRNQEVISFECLERIIPDGSFWVFEQDKNKQRYLQLDLEKRFRMINWKGLFGQVVQEDQSNMDKRSEMLKKLFAANKGMSKLTGKAPETIDEMAANPDLVKSITTPVDERGRVVGDDGEEGEYVSNDDFMKNFDINDYIKRVSTGGESRDDEEEDEQDDNILDAEVVESEDGRK